MIYLLGSKVNEIDGRSALSVMANRARTTSVHREDYSGEQLHNTAVTATASSSSFAHEYYVHNKGSYEI
jgi:hypothetical protein